MVFQIEKFTLTKFYLLQKLIVTDVGSSFNRIRALFTDSKLILGRITLQKSIAITYKVLKPSGLALPRNVSRNEFN